MTLAVAASLQTSLVAYCDDEPKDADWCYEGDESCECEGESSTSEAGSTPSVEPVIPSNPQGPSSSANEPPAETSPATVDPTPNDPNGPTSPIPNGQNGPTPNDPTPISQNDPIPNDPPVGTSGGDGVTNSPDLPPVTTSDPLFNDTAAQVSNTSIVNATANATATIANATLNATLNATASSSSSGTRSTTLVPETSTPSPQQTPSGASKVCAGANQLVGAIVAILSFAF